MPSLACFSIDCTFCILFIFGMLGFMTYLGTVKPENLFYGCLKFTKSTTTIANFLLGTVYYLFIVSFYVQIVI
jgi:hypothetical protein